MTQCEHCGRAPRRTSVPGAGLTAWAQVPTPGPAKDYAAHTGEHVASQRGHHSFPAPAPHRVHEFRWGSWRLAVVVALVGEA